MQTFKNGNALFFNVTITITLTQGASAMKLNKKLLSVGYTESDLQQIKTAASIAALMALTAIGVHNASNRRAEYLEQESEYYSCIESGLSRAECAAAVGW